MNRKGNSGFAGILDREAQAGRKRLADKVPQWKELAPELEIPSSLNLEQCSSGAAAEYKASLAGSCVGRIADLTGGLGVDCWAFSQVAGAVLHNERDRVLSAAVAANFRKLGIGNVQYTNFDIRVPDNPEYCDWIKSLREFHPDVIFADPARRDGTGRKVFLPQDCSPDISSLMPLLLKIAPRVLVKFSPMMDITALRECFGDCLKQLHIVCIDGEAKELLCVFCNDDIETGLFIFDHGLKLKLDFESEQKASARLLDGERELLEYKYLFEPGPGLMKAGLFKYICSRYGMTKLGRSTHLYLCTTIIPELEAFGKFFEILSILPFCKESFRLIATDFPHADLTARNLPVSTDELRRRLKITPGHNGSGVHIFAVTIDFERESTRKLIVTEAAI